jgi:hypothetical protein
MLHPPMRLGSEPKHRDLYVGSTSGVFRSRSPKIEMHERTRSFVGCVESSSPGVPCASPVARPVQRRCGCDQCGQRSRNVSSRSGCADSRSSGWTGSGRSVAGSTATAGAGSRRRRCPIVVGQCRLDLLILARPGYQQRLPSMIRHAQCSFRDWGSSALHSRATADDSEDIAMIMASGYLIMSAPRAHRSLTEQNRMWARCWRAANHSLPCVGSPTHEGSARGARHDVAALNGCRTSLRVLLLGRAGSDCLG